MRRLQRRYAIFCSRSVLNDFGDDDAGANGAKARSSNQLLSIRLDGRAHRHGDAPEFMEARFLNGLERSMKTMPMLNICTPPPDM